jgi:perosamine synthetase
MKYPLFDIYWEQDDIENVNGVLKRGSFWADGPEIGEFEKKLGSYIKRKYVVTFNSGTSALHAALLAFGITSGEVIVPSLSFISTANCVILAGAKPVFAEIENDTLGLDVSDVEKNITKNTRAIIPMHYGGRVCRDIQKIVELAKNKGIPVIEDNAESIGATLAGKMAGQFGDAVMLSFCQNKIITTGEGGAIGTDLESVYRKLLMIRSHGRVQTENVSYFSSPSIEDYIEVGYNFRMPTMCAALGLAQLSKIEKIIQLRRRVGQRYDELISEIHGYKIFKELPNARDVYQLYTISLEDPTKRSALQDYLLKEGILTKIYFAPIHLKSFYKNKYGYKEGALPRTERVSKSLISLPFSLHFSGQDQEFITGKLGHYFDS